MSDLFANQMWKNQEEDINLREAIRLMREMLAATSKGKWSPAISPKQYQSFEELLADIEESIRKGSLEWRGVSLTELDNSEGKWVCFTGNGPDGEANAKFIAHAREWMSFLLDALEERLT